MKIVASKTQRKRPSPADPKASLQLNESQPQTIGINRKRLFRLVSEFISVADPGSDPWIVLCSIQCTYVFRILILDLNVLKIFSLLLWGSYPYLNLKT